MVFSLEIRLLKGERRTPECDANVAAVDQLATWAEREGAEIVRPQGQGPAFVAFQTVEKAHHEGIEIVLVDTAGWLQTKSGLMDEIGKARRVIEKQAEVSEALLVLEATTGQNSLAQAQALIEHARVTGLATVRQTQLSNLQEIRSVGVHLTQVGAYDGDGSPSSRGGPCQELVWKKALQLPI